MNRTLPFRPQARCYTALKEYKLALAELETINSSHRSLPARLLLGKLYLQMGCARRPFSLSMMLK